MVGAVVNIAQWFKEFRLHLMESPEGRSLLEALTDSANERMVCALAASHLRKFGRTEALFWVRTEWGKYDISWGRAKDHFQNWEQAHTAGIAGYAGVIEAKVIYGFWPPEKKQVVIAEMIRQLRARRKNDGNDPTLEYFGLVTYVGPRDPKDAWNDPTIDWVDPDRPIVRLDESDVGALWPLERPEAWELYVGLYRQK
ncbi:MAG: hypothetical protein CMLOHMNK_03634 [Steroidobacteraceae bacterium]|nr:hypothetical protein [Steroidobacteraceae bacterium]